MAVEIPVVIDIDKAFAEAASKVPKAMKPLQEYMDASALRIKLDIGQAQKVSVKQIFEDANISAKQLNLAIADVESRISKLAAKGGFDLTKGLTAQEKNLMTIYGALEAKTNQAADGSRLIGKLYEVNIEKARTKVNQLTADIEKLTIKQNKAFRRSGDTFVPTKQYETLDASIKKANADLTNTKSILNTLSIEFEKVSASGVKAATAMGAIRTPAMQMVDAWKRGATYVERYNASLGVANSRLLTLIKSSLSLVALHSAISFVRNVRQVTSEFEMQRVALGGIIQDTEKAEQLFKQLKAAAIQSPFEIKDLVSFTKQLSAYRIETDRLFDVTMRLADVSAGLGVDMSRLVLAYGQVRAASVLRGQELRQFTEAGIPLVELLAEKFTALNHRMVSTAEVFELISKRAVPFSMIEEIFNDMTDAGGIFYKMQEKQSETLKGQWMKLKDALSIMYDEIGNTEKVHGAMESLLHDAMQLMQNWRQVGRNIGTVVAAMMAYKIAVINARIAQNALTAAEMAEVSALQLNVVGRSRVVAAILGENAAIKLQIKLSNLYVAAKSREMMATNMFTRALWRSVAALLANPYAAAIAGITALVVAITKLNKKTEEAAISSDDLQKAIASYDKSHRQVKEIDNLVDKYDSLIAKTERTQEEQEKLARVTKELAKAYPSAISGTDAYGNALEINTAKIKEATKAEQDLIQEILERKKIQAQEEVDSLVQRREEINKILREGGYRTIGGTDIAPEIEFHPLTTEEKEQFANELVDLMEKIEEFGAKINEADDKLQDFNSDLIGPPPPDFLGNPWKMRLNSYVAVLESSGDSARAFQNDQIEGFSSLKDALDETAKEYKAHTELVDLYTRALQSSTGAQREQIKLALQDELIFQSLYGKILSDYNAWNLIDKKQKSTTDKRLQELKNNISEITNAYKKFGELRKYKDEAESLMDIGTLFPQLGEFAPTFQNTIARLQSMLEDVKKQLAKRPKDAVLLDMQRALETEISNLNFDKLKQDLDDSIKQLSDEIKRSETARDFYQSILGLTGDEDLAATMSVSVYGGIGQDFKERLQQQLNAALSSLDASKITDDLRAAFASRDFDTILANLDKFPEVWQQKLKEMAESSQAFDADRAKDLLKALEKAKTYGEQRVKLAEETARRMKEIEEMSVPQPVKDQLQQRNVKKEAEDAAKLEYEAFKDTPMYIELFADLDSASVRMLTNMRENLIALKSQWKDLMPTELKELQSRINELDEQIAKRNPFKALIASIKTYRDMQKSMPRAEVDMSVITANEKLNAERQVLDELTKQYQEKVKQYGIDSAQAKEAKKAMEEQARKTDMAKDEADAAQEIASQYRRAAKHIMDAADGLQEWAGYVKSALDGAKGIVDVFGSEDFSETFGTIAEGTVQTLQGAGEAAMGLAKIFSGTDIAGGIMDLVSGIGDLVVGIGGTAKKLNVQQLNKQIKEQARLIQNLEESYDSLSKALDRAFGNERVYNFNKMMEVMAAEMEAYQKQAEAERAKGKKADEDTALGYERSARQLEEQMRDLRLEQDAFFAGADLASTAESFADAWLSAYQEFGDTSTAIEERMTEMVQTLMKKAALSGIAQNILGNWYASLADVKDWNAQTIAEKWKEAMALVNPMVEGMQVFANSMQAEGVSLRNNVGQFTGISRDIAGASEESINGLAAGINTQNFYMSFMPLIHENVAQILTYMTGGNTVTPATQTGIEGMPSVQKMVYDHLPNLDANINSLLQLVKSVISPKSAATATHYVSIK